jgi:hypothetical protein
MSVVEAFGPQIQEMAAEIIPDAIQSYACLLHGIRARILHMWHHSA